MSELLFKDESYKIIGACMDVHSELGPGFLEGVYQEALQKEFAARGIPCEREVKLQIMYKGEALNKQYYADFLCYGEIIIELKAVKKLLHEYEAQVFNYLKASELTLGLLVNFAKPSLEYKRIACTQSVEQIDF